MTESGVAATPPAQASLPLTEWTLADALAEKIRDHLVHGRISQRAFGKALGVSQGAVSYLLSAQRRQDTLDFCQRLASVFGQTPSQLFGELERRVFVSFASRDQAQAAAVRAAVQRQKESSMVLIHAAIAGEPPHAPRRALSASATTEEQLAVVQQQIAQLREQYQCLLTQLLRDGQGTVLGTITLLPAAPGAPLPAGVPPSGLPVDQLATDHRQAPAAGAAERRRRRRRPGQRRTPAR